MRLIAIKYFNRLTALIYIQYYIILYIIFHVSIPCAKLRITNKWSGTHTCGSSWWLRCLSKADIDLLNYVSQSSPSTGSHLHYIFKCPFHLFGLVQLTKHHSQIIDALIVTFSGISPWHVSFITEISSSFQT